MKSHTVRSLSSGSIEGGSVSDSRRLECCFTRLRTLLAALQTVEVRRGAVSAFGRYTRLRRRGVPCCRVLGLPLSRHSRFDKGAVLLMKPAQHTRRRFLYDTLAFAPSASITCRAISGCPRRRRSKIGHERTGSLFAVALTISRSQCLQGRSTCRVLHGMHGMRTGHS